MTPDEYRQKALEAPVMRKWGYEIAAGDQQFVLEGPKGPKKIGN
jgi:hypothetical protein